jgi:mRNA interferase MazF
MLTSGDVVDLDPGLPEGREAGFRHPGVVVTAQPVLRRSPTVVQVVPLTSTLRDLTTEVAIPPDAGNGLEATSAAQCQHVRAVSTRRVLGVRGNVGPATLAQVREILGVLLDIP